MGGELDDLEVVDGGGGEGVETPASSAFWVGVVVGFVETSRH